MNKKGSTPDERFLIKLYEMAQESPIDPKAVATAVSLKEKATNTIIKTLAQSNFVKKEDDGKIFLTSRGVQFVQDELAGLSS